MQVHKIQHLYLLILVLCFYLAIGCESLTPRYDSVSYQNAVTLRFDSLELMDKATEPYDDYVSDVNDLLKRIELAYEHAKGQEKNKTVTKQWEKLKDPNGGLVGGFMKRWQEQKKLSEIVIEGAKDSVAYSFDQIIELEDKKIRRD